MRVLLGSKSVREPSTGQLHIVMGQDLILLHVLFEPASVDQPLGSYLLRRILSLFAASTSSVRDGGTCRTSHPSRSPTSDQFGLLVLRPGILDALHKSDDLVMSPSIA